ncbi:hypothetical protein HMPREF1624_06347 [Sporothrix schenckii ATCC 58251]|uniref:Uncharacterized protein n=1 Tax=Sporothrix schenckii (strain ATCC 58251 / de Perez 2211183) TaxID=1391915 RepID=U7PRC9_SPOS1|nr:hypothetical protein HMPREF1624_06347 [Sporothrix schenckii ATCC 58251]
MADFSSAPVGNSDSSERPTNNSAPKPSLETAKLSSLPDLSLPPKPVFVEGSTTGNNASGALNPDSNAAAKKDDSPSSSVGGGLFNGSTAVTDKKDSTDFAKPVTPVSEANGGIDTFHSASGGGNGSSDNKPTTAPLPLIDEAPAEKPGPSEPTATSSVPTASAPSVTLIAPTAPTTNGSAVPSLPSGLPPKPAEPSAPSQAVAPAESVTSGNAIVGEKRKADEAADDKSAAAAPEASAPAPVSSLFGGSAATSSSLPAKPLAATVESADDSEDGASAAKKLKTDTKAETATAADAAPTSTPAAPPVEVPAPSPVTVATPAADPITAPVGAPAGVAPALEVNLGPAPSADKIASTSTTALGVKKSNSRAKREKKPLPPVGKTARKTRSQGPA